ncbi:MAG: hypothetical protein JNL11_03680 [Bdellovibrionaceae bacterium]|nr:hypothetical protein [Pseudobdellovibrionaceae bacterium]
MGMLDRYKKKGGFVQLLNLLETSSKAKQEQFLTLISQENVNWEMELKKRVLTVDKIIEWPREPLNEIISRIQPLTLAVALRKFEPPKRDEILNVLSQSEKRKILSLIDETTPNAAEIATCLSKIVTEVRGLIQQGIIKLEKFNPDMAVPENIEELINQKTEGHSIPTSVDAMSATNSTPTVDGEAEVKLDFSGANNRKEAAKNDKLEALKEENDFLKKKVNQLTQESTTLKIENSVLKNKLDQIKKIA